MIDEANEGHEARLMPANFSKYLARSDRIATTALNYIAFIP